MCLTTRQARSYIYFYQAIRQATSTPGAIYYTYRQITFSRPNLRALLFGLTACSAGAIVYALTSQAPPIPRSFLTISFGLTTAIITWSLGTAIIPNLTKPNT